MIESEIRGGICQSINRYSEANNKYMKNYDKNIPSSYLEYLHANNLYGCAICKKLPVDNFRWAEDPDTYTQSFIRNYDEKSNYGSVLEVDIEYPKSLWDLHKDLPFIAGRRKLGNVEKQITSIDDKESYVIHITHKRPKTSTKSQINIKESTQSNRLWERSMTEAIYRHEHQTKNKCKERLRERLL